MGMMDNYADFMLKPEQHKNHSVCLFNTWTNYEN